jgi:hypothetical protein
MTHDTNQGSARLREAILQSEAKQYGALPEAEDELQYSGRYIRKINSLCRKPSLPLSAPGRRVKKYAAVALLSCLILITGIFSVSATRTAVTEWFVNIYESFTEIFSARADLEQKPDTIETAYTPTAIPEGYQHVENYLAQSEWKITWKNASGDSIYFIQTTLSSKATVDNEEAECEMLRIADKQCLLIRKNGKICIYWNGKDYAFSLIVPEAVTTEQYSAIIDSVEKQSNPEI